LLLNDYVAALVPTSVSITTTSTETKAAIGVETAFALAVRPGGLSRSPMQVVVETWLQKSWESLFTFGRFRRGKAAPRRPNETHLVASGGRMLASGSAGCCAAGV